MKLAPLVRLVCTLVFATVGRAEAPRLVNLSSRATVGTGEDVVITGFVIGPGSNATVLIRGLGPLLQNFGVAGALSDPDLLLSNSSGALASNDNWLSSDAATMNAVGAYPLNASSKDSALVRTLAPGVYSAKVSGVSNTAGISLLELYEVNATSSTGRLANISTRTQIGVGNNILISGLVVANGSGTRRLLVRAAGPALLAYDVAGALLDPSLSVINSDTGAVVATNDNWGTPTTAGAADASALTNTFLSFGAFPFAVGSKDAALIADLGPGKYSINVSGVSDTTGIALAEVYDISTEGSPVVTLVATKTAADESGSNPGEFTFTRTGDASLPLSVTYSFGGTATVGSDYTAGTGNLEFPAGSSAVKLSVAPRADILTEGNETVVLTLKSGVGYVVGTSSTGTVNIADLVATLYVANLRPTSGASASTASGTATILLSPDGSYGYVSVTFSNLSSTQTVAYLRVGSANEVGTELLLLNNGQVESAYWGIQGSGALSAADLRQALRDGRIFISIESSAYPAGELRGAFILGAGSQNFTVPAAPPSINLSTITDADAARFLQQATFGPTMADIDALKQKGYTTWFAEQIATPMSVQRTLILADFAANDAGGQNTGPGTPNNRPGQAHRHATWWKMVLTGDDQLRQRVALALSEIFVISDANGTVSNAEEGMANYYDLLASNAFGNFRTLLEDVSLSPMMGIFLSHLRNAKATSATGAQPDENYAREIMQLFTIGLNQLQPDGTLKLDANALPIGTYSQSTVTQMAKVFTGFAFHGTDTSDPKFRANPVDYINPMSLYPGYHDVTAKTIVGDLVLPANRSGLQDFNDTLDALFNHANTGPFICAQLIQRLVTSNPSPAYVYRVAQVFANNGSGVRGDLGAVVRAILTDYEARSATVAANTGFGKLKEPLLRLTHLSRAANITATTGRFAISNEFAQTGQAALSAPTVFNFFEPYYVKPGTLAAAGLYAPEFQILTATTAMSIPNYIFSFIFTGMPGLSLACTDLLPLATQPTQLVDRLNLLFAANAMTTTTKTRLVTFLNALPASTTSIDRVRSALYLVTTSSDGAVQH